MLDYYGWLPLVCHSRRTRHKTKTRAGYPSCPRSVTENRVLSGKSFVPACKYILTRWYVCLFVRPLSEVSNRVLFGGWDFFFFYHHVRRRVRGGSYVCLFVCPIVCPRNYLNNIQDIIKVHFCQLKLVVSFNNILYT